MPVTLPEIRPISDLRTDLNGICESARASQQPIVLTKNGKASLVVIDFQAYERQQEHERYVAKLREAEIEAKYNPETISAAQLNDRMGRLFSEMERCNA